MAKLWKSPTDAGLQISGLAMGYVLVKYRDVATTITELFAGRLREILSSAQYDVRVQGLALVVERRDKRGVAVVTPSLHLASPGSASEKLCLAFEAGADAVRQQVAGGAPQQVRVDDDWVAVWWGTGPETRALARLAPIARSEIGL